MCRDGLWFGLFIAQWFTRTLRIGSYESLQKIRFRQRDSLSSWCVSQRSECRVFVGVGERESRFYPGTVAKQTLLWRESGSDPCVGSGERAGGMRDERASGCCCCCCWWVTEIHFCSLAPMSCWFRNYFFCVEMAAPETYGLLMHCFHIPIEEKYAQRVIIINLACCAFTVAVI